MCSFTLEDMVDKMDHYLNIFKKYGFRCDGLGKKSYSIKYTKPDTGESVEYRDSDWTFYKSDGNETVGRTPKELEVFLDQYFKF